MLESALLTDSWLIVEIYPCSSNVEFWYKGYLSTNQVNDHIYR